MDAGEVGDEDIRGSREWHSISLFLMGMVWLSRSGRGSGPVANATGRSGERARRPSTLNQSRGWSVSRSSKVADSLKTVVMVELTVNSD